MKHSIAYIFCAFWLLIQVQPLYADRQDSYQRYIAQYYKLAQEQQRLHGIPASITLAQGLLESAAGESKLARVARNHFGVKCHDWEGDAVKYKGDCYRMYESVAESYEDHSMFLLRSRYAPLFDLKVTDYKGWARGLKKYGYAEDPKYPEKLIAIIERYNLQQYVKGIKGTKSVEPVLPEVEIKRDIFRAWGMLYVLAEEGDTYEQIAADTGFEAKQLAQYNDHDCATLLGVGEIVYLEKKKIKADEGYDEHVVREGESFRSIAQIYGIDVKRLARRNKMRHTDALQAGQKIVLR